jgi:sensor histidine kinase regulating citrate/malate metabolism
MRLYSDMSIRHKLQGIVVISCAVVLLVASAMFTVYDQTTFRRAKAADLVGAAKMIGSINTAALAFHDTKSAHEILSTLHINKYVLHDFFSCVAEKPFSAKNPSFR